MGNFMTISAADGHQLQAYEARPFGAARGAVVVVQEIFGVNVHIRDVCDRFAAAGYLAMAPALFDRLETGVELGYDEPGVTRGRALVEELGWEHPIADVWAAATALRADGRVGVTGYCWGGSVTWLAACRLDVAAASSYYGRHIVEFLDETPRCRVECHFGEKDALIPAENVEKLRAAHPTVPVFTYPAGHGFNCDRRADFHADSARTAWGRTLELFETSVPPLTPGA